MCELGTGARICTIYSFVGILFTAYIGALLVNQPFYIKDIGDVDKAKSSIFTALGIFVFAFIASVVGLKYDSQQNKDDANGGENYQLNQATGYGSRYD
mmetsp:Transcript_44481/g.87266  ORF Transcript_44481/g.87266 Transcript_44481/m.87266 type:complete len:98 (-) Transcript_44481:409-702(-)